MEGGEEGGREAVRGEGRWGERDRERKGGEKQRTGKEGREEERGKR